MRVRFRACTLALLARTRRRLGDEFTASLKALLWRVPLLFTLCCCQQAGTDTLSSHWRLSQLSHFDSADIASPDGTSLCRTSSLLRVARPPLRALSLGCGAKAALLPSGQPPSCHSASTRDTAESRLLCVWTGLSGVVVIRISACASVPREASGYSLDRS